MTRLLHAFHEGSWTLDRTLPRLGAVGESARAAGREQSEQEGKDEEMTCFHFFRVSLAQVRRAPSKQQPCLRHPAAAIEDATPSPIWGICPSRRTARLRLAALCADAVLRAVKSGDGSQSWGSSHRIARCGSKVPRWPLEAGANCLNARDARRACRWRLTTGGRAV